MHAGHETIRQHLSRRTFLVAGGLGFSGLALPDLAHARRGSGPARSKKAKSTILLWLSGGASHIDTWDMKPDAPVEYPLGRIQERGGSMSQPVDHYGTAYGNFAKQTIEAVRCKTYGEDFGQSSWFTGDEYRRFFHLLELRAADHVLDVGCGSGGLALFLTREVGCRVTGLDVNEVGIRAGLTLVRAAGMQEKVHFQTANELLGSLTVHASRGWLRTMRKTWVRRRLHLEPVSQPANHRLGEPSIATMLSSDRKRHGSKRGQAPLCAAPSGPFRQRCLTPF